MGSIKAIEVYAQKDLTQLMDRLNNMEQQCVVLLENVRTIKEILSPSTLPQTTTRKKGLSEKDKADLISGRRKRAYKQSANS